MTHSHAHTAVKRRARWAMDDALPVPLEAAEENAKPRWLHETPEQRRARACFFVLSIFLVLVRANPFPRQGYPSRHGCQPSRLFLSSDGGV